MKEKLKTREEIEKSCSSICYDCEFARAAMDKRHNEGVVACVARFDQFPIGNPSLGDIAYIREAELVGTAWIYHKRRPFALKDNTLAYGMMTNGQIVTKGVKDCSEFKIIK